MDNKLFEILNNDILLQSIKKYLKNQRQIKDNEMDDINIDNLININNIINKYHINLNILYNNYYFNLIENDKLILNDDEHKDKLLKYKKKLLFYNNKYEYYKILNINIDMTNELNFFNIQINKYLNKIMNI